MKLSTGKVGIPIEFDNGDKQTIFFNPNDPDLMIRMKNLESKVEERIKGFDDIELTLDGAPSESAHIEVFEKMQNILKEELDHAFGGHVSGVVFKHCSPFVVVDGEYFIVQFIRAITPEIAKHIEKANAEAHERIGKHINKYK